LKVHTAKSKVELVAQEVYDQPRMVESTTVKPNLALMGKTLGKLPGYKSLLETLRTMEPDDVLALKENLSKGKYTMKLCDGNSFELDSTLIDFKTETKKVSAVKYTPSVIEPSFGIGRILYHILEHAFKIREDAQPSASDKEAKALRAYLTLPAFMAPIKVAVLPISTKEALNATVESLTRSMTTSGISARADTSGQSIGRRYARLDEVGVPFILTVDFESMQDNCVTLRERDSMQQIRIPIAEATSIVSKLVQASVHAAQNKILQASSVDAKATTDEWEWCNVYQRFPQVQRPEGGEE
jgi:glycyl-tRNA synthetase